MNVVVFFAMLIGGYYIFSPMDVATCNLKLQITFSTFTQTLQIIDEH
jgi:hypothetical protein